MSTQSGGLGAIVAQAVGQERAYDWRGACKSYKKALSLIDQNDLLALGETYERLGYASYRAAMQAKSREEFRDGVQQAVEVYEKARGFYDQLEVSRKARTLRCEAVARFFGWWLSDTPADKRRLLDECLDLEAKGLTAFLDLGLHSEYVGTFNVLALAVWHRSFLEWDRQALRSMIERGCAWAEKAVELADKNCDSYERGRAYAGLGLVRVCDTFGYFFIEDPKDQNRVQLETIEIFRKAVEFSQKAGDAYSMSLSYYWIGLYSGAQESLVQKSLEFGKEAHDNFLEGAALDLLAYVVFWKSAAIEDPDQRSDLSRTAMEFYDRAQCHFGIMSYQSPRWGALPAPAGYAEHYLHSADWELDPQKKVAFLELSEKAGIEALKVAEASDLPLIVDSTLHVLGKTLEARARLEQHLELKRNFLRRALEHRERAVEIAEQLTPYDYWDRGVEQAGLAAINTQLSSLEEDCENKKNLLVEATSQSETSIELAEKGMPFLEELGRKELFSSLYKMQDSHVVRLTRLYELTNNPDLLEKAVETSQDAIKSAEKIDVASHVAESNWKLAKLRDILGDHLNAAESFLQASASYGKASERIPQLKPFYQDYATYMEAWAEIERARHFHAEKQLEDAKEHYEKAARLHESTKRWSYLSPNYFAWARLEEAENLSRRERAEEAKAVFEKADGLFLEAKRSIGAELENIDVLDEKEMAEKLFKSSDLRCKYCLGRIALEEAKIFDRKGDHPHSSEKFSSATEIFEKIAKALDTEEDKREVELIAILARAWQKMIQAEVQMSPSKYLEAAQLFEMAKDLSSDENTKKLSMGNYHFCKALELGTKFVDTMDPSMRNSAVQELESAAGYYLEAGSTNASDYAKATGLLFDAYVYIDQAKKETDPEKKTKLYIVTEKILETSAGHFERAEQLDKLMQVRRLLEEIKKEKEFALSLAEVLHEPILISTTSFPVPSPSSESAVGSERFEHADVQANLKVSEEIDIGEPFEVIVDLVNVGNNQGLLVRLDNVVPQGMKIASLAPQCDVEDHSVNLRGRRIDPLKVESIKMSLQATTTGMVSLKPRLVYIDDTGKFRTSMPEPAGILVHPKVGFEFHTKAAQDMFNYLVNSFADDYMKRKMMIEKSGWRTLNELVTRGRIPKSSVYGAGGSRGRDMAELERRGIVESRIFQGERGRGGNILKVRVPYDKETIKRYIDGRVMKK